jgi:hypothetical protein
MLKEQAIQLNEIKGQMEEGKFVIRVKINNPHDRTLYAYGSPRRTFYDNTTGKLTLLLHDQHLSAEEERIYSPHLRQPRFVPLEAKTETELVLKLEPVFNRLLSAAERGTGPAFEELRISEAKEIDIEIAHQDTPFYYNPKIDNAKQLKDWGKAVAKAKFQISPGKAESSPVTWERVK